MTGQAAGTATAEPDPQLRSRFARYPDGRGGYGHPFAVNRVRRRAAARLTGKPDQSRPDYPIDPALRAADLRESARQLEVLAQLRGYQATRGWMLRQARLFRDRADELDDAGTTVDDGGRRGTT